MPYIIAAHMMGRDGTDFTPGGRVGDSFESREEAVAEVEDHILQFAHHGYNEEQDYWWSRSSAERNEPYWVWHHYVEMDNP